MKFRTPWYETVSRDTIWLATAPVNDETMPALPPAMQDFQSADQVGAATFDYPLHLPGGLLPPALMLYSNSFVADESRTHQGGALGVGTSLGEYAILRQSDSTPDQPADDAFVLLWEGVRSPLTYADPAAGGDGYYYRARELAGQELRIVRQTGASHGGDYWEITDAQGVTWRFGYNSDSSWRYVDNNDNTHPWRWNLDRVTDTQENYQTWSYQTEPGSHNGVGFERGGYLAEIAWNGNATTGQAPDRKLAFTYTNRTSGTPDYDPATERFYLTKRLDRIAVEVAEQLIWDYQFAYEEHTDGGRTQVLLSGITQRGTDSSTTLADVDLSYQPPVEEGEGYHLREITLNGTPRLAYTYERFDFNGSMRYRVNAISWNTVAGASAQDAQIMPVAFAQNLRTMFNISYGPAKGDPGGESFWTFERTTIDDGSGNRQETRYRTEPPFHNLAYKQFCEMNSPGAAAQGVSRVPGMAMPSQLANFGAGDICHEQVSNYDAVTLPNGSTRLLVPSSFEDTRQDDGSVQHTQTNYTYNNDGQPIFIDQYGEQGTPDDDRFIEREYRDASFADLVTDERVRDTQGQTVAHTNYAYVPGTRLLAEVGNWLLEESRVLTTTFSYDDRGLLTSVTDPMGHTVQYGYDTAGNRTSVTDARGHTTTFDYDPLGRLIEATNPRGATTTYAYDPGTGMLTSVTDPLGHTTAYTYDARLRKIAEEDPRGGITRYGYDELDQMVVMTDTLGFATRYEYNERGQQTAIIDPEGHRSIYDYDIANGWLIASENPLGERTQFTYDGAGHLVASTDARGHTTRIAYDSFGRPIAATDPLGHTTTTSYDTLGRVVAETDALDHATTYTYDSLGRLLRMTDPLSQTTTYTYDDAGRRTAMTNARGHTTTYTYDPAGQVTTTTDALSNSTQYGYDAVGNTTVITDANGHATMTAYDPLNRPTEVRNAEGHVIQYGYDAMGNVTVLTDTLGHTATVQYDALNRPVISTDQEGRTTQSTYTPRGLLASSTDGAGIVTRYRYDELGRLDQVLANAQDGTAPSADVNVATSYTYDAVGNLLTVTDPNDNTTSFGYDARNQRISLTDPLDRVWQSTYDARGLLATWTKPDTTTLSYRYDALGQLTTLTTPDETITRAYDAAGNLVSLSDQTGTTTVAYDALNRPLTVTLSVGGTVGYGYDAVGNRTSTRYPDGSTVQTAYNAANQPVQYDDWSGGTTTLAYDPNGRLETTTRPNGAMTTATYDRSGRPTRMTHTAGGTTVGDYQYTYDATGRRVQAIDNGTVITATYDGLYRLLQQQASSGASYAYSYDANGNRLTAQEPGQTTTATYDAANQLATLNGAAVQYDANGNLRDDGTTSYTYDALDRLIRVTRGISETTFAYNGNGDRVGQTVDGVPTTYVLDLNAALTQVLAQQGPAGTTRFLAGVGQETNGVWQYHHTDALGSLRALTDSSGAVVGTMDYTPFGAVAQAAGVLAPQGFTGEFQDNGLVYLRARYYHPTLGRFLTPDSIVPDATNGQDWNAYAYVRNDPWNWTDPSGHAPSDWNEVLDYIGRAARQGFEDVKDGAQVVSDWWNREPVCVCSKTRISTFPEFMTTPGFMTALNIGAQGAWGLISAPIDMYRTTILEMQHPATGKWHPQFQHSHLMSPRDRIYAVLMPNNLDYTIGFDPLPDDYIGRRVHVTTNFLNHNSWKGVAGTLKFGAAIDALFQGISDWHEDPCRSPKEFALRSLMAGLFGVGVGVVGVVGVGLASAVGAGPLIAGAVGFGIAMGVGLALAPVKQAMLNSVTAPHRRR